MPGRLALLVLVALAAGCRPADPAEIDPRTLPEAIEVVRVIRNTAIAADLDADGRDELIGYRFSQPDEMHSGGAVLITTQDEVVIGQANFQGYTRHAPLTVDLNQDGTLEVVVPIARNDSLFGQVMDHRGRIGRRFFITSGAPRLQWPEGEAEAVPDTIAWDPRLVAMMVDDLDGDRQPELLSVIATGYARHPRGVVIHELPDLVRRAELSVGAGLDLSVAGTGRARRRLQDFDADGVPELIWSAGAWDNGASEGGFTDDQAYLLHVELDSLHVSWSEVMGLLYTHTVLHLADFDGDGRDEWLTGVTTSRVGHASELRIYDARSRQVRLRRPAPESVHDVEVVELDGDPRPEVLVSGVSGTLYLYDHDLRLVAERSWPDHAGHLHVVSDVDGDGRDEVLLAGDRLSTLLLGENLSIRALLDDRLNTRQAVRQGPGEPKWLLASLSGTYDSALLRITGQPLWWLYHYGPPAGWALGLGLVLIGGAVTTRRLHAGRVAEAAYRELQRDPAAFVLVADERGRLRDMSPRLQSLLHSNGQADAETVKARAPELHALLGKLRSTSTGRDDPIAIHGQPFTVHAEPLRVGRRTYWLLRLRAEHEDAAPSEAWRLMARRVAHDLKNPLTAILLTVQRMQREAEEASAEAGERLVPHAERVAGRVEHLRRMTRTFMKFAGIEEPVLEKGDVGRFTEDLAAELRAELPPDVELVVQRGEAPTVAFDREQLRSVLENLVTNAVTAMPDGGTVTLSVSEGKGLLVDEEPQDYAVIEVLDTGVGMSDEVRRRAFEAGYTTRADGTGVGLAVVEQVVRRHRGAVEVRSEEGVGTEVCLYLPSV